MKNGFKLFLVLSVVLIVIDQLVKLWARTTANGIEGNTLLALWPNVFELKLVFNKGVAFGMMQGAGIYLTPVAVGIAGLAGWYSFKHEEGSTSVHVTSALLAAGAIGNLVDRLAFGRVTDMFWIRAINFPVFNVADICITIAGAMFVLGAIKDSVKKPVQVTPDATVTEEPT